MQHASQHEEAIKKTVRVRNEVSATIFDDKVRPMGTVQVENGKITVTLDFLPGMIDAKSTGDFVVDSIALGVKACWEAKSEAFG